MEKEEGKKGEASGGSEASTSSPTQPVGAEAPSNSVANKTPKTSPKNETPKETQNSRRKNAATEAAWERLSAKKGHHRNLRQSEAQNRKGKDSLELRQRVRTRSQRDEPEEGDGNLRAKTANNQKAVKTPPPKEEEPITKPFEPKEVPYNWQASKANLRERLMFIYSTDTMADVRFLVGKEAQLIPAHRFVLCIGSAVFDAMFNGAMATTESDIELPDVEPPAFLALLRFLYSDEVVIGPDTVMTTLYTAKKYAVPALEQACVDFLKQNLTPENAFMLLTQARLFDEPQLAAICLDTIDRNTTEALSADGFSDIDLNTLTSVLQRDTLGIREVKLFKAVCRWTEAECARQSLEVTAENQRQVLGNALSLVRFPLMTVEEFAVEAAQTGLLGDREVVELFLYFTVDPKPPVTFSDVPRCCLTGKEQVVSRFVHTEHRWGYSGTSDRIRFAVNRRIFVVGFGLYGSIQSPSEYGVTIQIIQTESGESCGSNDCSFQADGTSSTFRVMFKEPIEVNPNTNYTASATLKGPDSYYGSRGLRKVTHESVTSGKVTFQFNYAAGNNNGTSVEDGQIPEIIFYTST